MRYVPGGKGVVDKKRKLGQSKATKIQGGIPGKGPGVRFGFIAETGEIAVRARGKLYRRRVYQR